MKNFERGKDNSIQTAFAVIVCSECVMPAWERFCLIPEK